MVTYDSKFDLTNQKLVNHVFFFFLRKGKFYNYVIEGNIDKHQYRIFALSIAGFLSKSIKVIFITDVSNITDYLRM